jgi:hypothetical protein
MRRAFLAAMMGAVMALAAGQAEASPDPTALDQALARHIRADAAGLHRVDYAGWKANRADHQVLEAFIVASAGAQPSRMARAERFAYWANLYNAITIDLIIETFPVSSIRKIRSAGTTWSFAAVLGPWKTPVVTVEGRELSLDDIEHKILRPQFNDPRVHYAVNCASVGCPNLPVRLWRAETLDADLDAAARAFINSDRGVQVLDEGRAVRLSSIYQWFAKDFGDANGLRTHLARYATGERAGALKAGARIAGYQYDWSLNGGVGNLK